VAVPTATGEQVSYQDLSVAQFAEILRGAGLPGEFADAIADADRSAAKARLTAR
jgi:NAD(P)H dehydrogenase (quinone)